MIYFWSNVYFRFKHRRYSASKLKTYKSKKTICLKAPIYIFLSHMIHEIAFYLFESTLVQFISWSSVNFNFNKELCKHDVNNLLKVQHKIPIDAVCWIKLHRNDFTRKKRNLISSSSSSIVIESTCSRLFTIILSES